MKIDIGDRIKFLNEVGTGQVIKIIDKKTALILNEDEFEVPYLIRELLKIEEEPNFFRAKQVNNEPVEEKKEAKQELKQKINFRKHEKKQENDSLKDTEEINIYIAFVPLSDKIESKTKFEVFLINDSNWYLLYNYKLMEKDKYSNHIGQLEPNIKDHIRTIVLNDIVQFKELIFQSLAYKNEPTENKVPINEMIPINAQNFYNKKSYRNNDFFDEKAIIYTILEEDLMQDAMDKLSKDNIFEVIKKKEVQSKEINKPKQAKKQKVNNLVEIDLHIHNLIDNETGLQPKDKLDIQMNKFREELEVAIKNHKTKKIVFIHGKGKSVLKNEIRRELQRKYKKLNFQDASFKEYGFGATLVYV